MKRCVIVGGAPISNYEMIRKYLKKDDYFIFCDGGLRHRERLNAAADLIIGDFDSYSMPQSDNEMIVLPCEKDDTDTFFAAREAVKRGFDEFLILGAVGGRLDHSMCNLSMLLYLYRHGKHAVIIDDFSVMTVVGSEVSYVSDDFLYFSLMNIAGDAKGVTVKNAKYPLCDAEIKSDYTYSVSNQVLKGKKAEITVKEGQLLLIKVFGE